MIVPFIADRFSRSLRNDGFARFTTIVSIASVAIGSLALIVSISVLNGYEELIEETALSYLSHIEVRAVGTESLEDTDVLQSAIAELEGVTSVEPVIVRGALARTRDGVDGVFLHGLGGDRLSTIVGSDVSDGVYVGQELARRLALAKGDTLVIYAEDERSADAIPILFSVTIAGTITSGMQSIDESIVAMDIETLKTHLRVADDQPTMLTVTLHDANEAENVAREIAGFAPGTVMVLTWHDRYRSIASWIELQKKPIPIILGLISLVAVFTVASTLLVAVVEKTRSLAVLLAIGMAPKAVMMIVAIRGLRIGLIGSMFGVGIAGAFAIIQRTWQPISLDGTIYYVNALPVSADPAPYIIVPLISIALTLAASLIPMLVARNVRPAQALRFS